MCLAASRARCRNRAVSSARTQPWPDRRRFRVPLRPRVFPGQEEVQRQVLRMFVFPVLEVARMALPTRACSSLRRRYGKPSYAASRISAWRNRYVPPPSSSTYCVSRGRMSASIAASSSSKSARAGPVEAHPEDRRVPKHRLRSSAEPIDLRGDDPLDGVRQPLHRPVARAARRSSCTNSELPPDRPLSSATSCGSNGASSLAGSIRLTSASAGSGVSDNERQRGASGRTNPVSSSRRLTHMSHGDRRSAARSPEQIRRAVVHPMRVLDHDQRRLRDHPREEVAGDLLELRLRNSSPSSSTSRVIGRSTSATIPSNGSHGSRSGARGRTPSPSRSAISAASSPAPARGRVAGAAGRAVGHRRFVNLAPGHQLRQIRSLGPEFGQQPGLPHPGIPHDLDH